MTAPCQYPGCGEGEFDRAHTCIVDIPHSAYLRCHPYNPLPPEPTSAPGGLVTGPCQFPGCGASERDPLHRPCENHLPIISCHPYEPTPTEPISALGYLLGELGRGATQSAGEKADGGGKAHEAKQGRAPTSGNEGSNPSPTSALGYLLGHVPNGEMPV